MTQAKECLETSVRLATMANDFAQGLTSNATSKQAVRAGKLLRAARIALSEVKSDIRRMSDMRAFHTKFVESDGDDNDEADDEHKPSEMADRKERAIAFEEDEVGHGNKATSTVQWTDAEEDEFADIDRHARHAMKETSIERVEHSTERFDEADDSDFYEIDQYQDSESVLSDTSVLWMKTIPSKLTSGAVD